MNHPPAAPSPAPAAPSSSPSSSSAPATPADTFARSAPVRLWEDGFAADPHRYYAALKAQGPLGWAELAPGVPAYVVTDRRAALDLLRDAETWSHDPRPWESTVAEDAPILGMMRWRPNTLFSDGDAHVRYRRAFADAVDLVEPADLRERVHRAVDILIGRFGPVGHADLVADFARPLMSLIFNNLFGLPDSESGRLEVALGKMMEGGVQAAEGEAEFGAYVLGLIAVKSETRGPDLTSWLLDHPEDLTAEEVTWQVFLTLGAGHEPTANLVSNALSRILGNPDFYTTLTSGSRPVMDAVVEVLRYETPLSNYGIHFAREPLSFHGVWVRAAVPVVISYGALGHFAEQESGGAHHPGDASHLSWSAGEHSCPVKQHTLLIATEAIERLTQWLPDLEPTTDRDRLTWRPGPFHRSLTALPVRFTPRTPDQTGDRA
ncbi:cytochrome P450 [Streptomyces sp. NPDC088910]|uniref:cytochrome P450 n=1 Tax=Streptomyces sp. NPDC088910 TaxID=3365911 RepID=UPI003826DDC5